MRSGMCEVLQCSIHPTHHAAKATQQFWCMRPGFCKEFPRYKGEQPYKMGYATGGSDCCDGLTCGCGTHLRQQERWISCCQVLQSLVLQVKDGALLFRMCNLQDECFSRFRLQVEVVVELARQDTRGGAQAVQFKGDAPGIVYTEN